MHHKPLLTATPWVGSLGVALIAAIGCSAPRTTDAPAQTSPPPTDQPTTPVRPTIPWGVSLEDDVVGLEGGVWFTWERGEPWGIAEHSAATGERVRVRPIDKLNINGSPRYWEQHPEGVLAHWDEPLMIQEDSSGKLSVAWRAPEGRWQSSHLRIGDVLWTTRYDNGPSSVVALSLKDGSILWQERLPEHAQSTEVSTDGERLYVTWQEYSASAPTPQMTIPKRIRAYDLATRKALWTRDFAETPGALVASQNMVVAAVGAEVHFIEGSTGRVVYRETLGRPNIYPTMVVDGEVVYVGLWESLWAFRVRDGQKIWQRPASLDGGPVMKLRDELLLVTTRHRTLRALNREDGALRWELGIGAGSPNKIMVNTQAIVIRGSHSATGFAMPPRIVKESGVVRGRLVEVKCLPSPQSLDVLVGDVRLQTEPDGRFEARFEGAGVIWFWMVGPDMTPGLLDVGFPIPLDGSGEYDVGELRYNNCDRRWPIQPRSGPQGGVRLVP